MVCREIVVDDAEGLVLAAAAGVDRIELCSALSVGALTPSPGLMRMAAGCGVPVVAMIRPRPGDFLYSADELAVMLADIAAVRAAGLAGIAIGVTDATGRLDREAMARQIEAAGPLEVTIHRAFDVTPDQGQALEDALALGALRIMSAGHAAAAMEGVARLRALVQAAAGRVQIMAGGGVTAENAAALMAAGVDALHASCTALRPVGGPLGPLRIAADRMVTDAGAIAALRAVMRQRGDAGAVCPRTPEDI